jgi:outer membrane lipoprotein LolB
MSAGPLSGRGLYGAALVWFCALLTACSAPSKRQEYVTPNDVWEGRLSVQVAGDAPQRISADFFLEGTARRASLTLNSPLGTRMARMQWDATSATLESGDQKRSFDSVDAMTSHSLGSALPLQAIFAWLHGRPETAPGWELQTLDRLQGRIRARSVDRTPAVQIDLLLEPR